MRVRLPEDLHRTECTLPWRWWTANSCVPTESYGYYFDDLAKDGWDAGKWCDAVCGICEETGMSMSSAPVVWGCAEESRSVRTSG